MLYMALYPSPVGELTLASEGESLTGLWIAGQKYHGAAALSATAQWADLPIFRQTEEWLEAYFAGERPAISRLALSPGGGKRI